MLKGVIHKCNDAIIDHFDTISPVVMLFSNEALAKHCHPKFLSPPKAVYRHYVRPLCKTTQLLTVCTKPCLAIFHGRPMKLIKEKS